LSAQIAAQGEKVRALKEAKADKAAIAAEVKTLLDLKASYKAAAGRDWQPDAAKPGAKVPAPAAATATAGADISGKVAAQGDLVRKLKAEKANKADIDAAVKALLALKQEYKAATGQDWKPEQPAVAAGGAAPAAGAKAAKAATPVKAKSPPVAGNGGGS
jgi:bifunctional glutamyl/prolyl-tRNA synthetase